MRANSLRYLALIATLFALGVILLGAFTRLTDAGLGCPDWPGCYGKIVLPSTATGLTKAQLHYPQVPIEARKAWTEMIHRYLAGSLVFLVLFIALKLIKLRIQKGSGPWRLPIILLFLLGLQAALGMWTVTLKLWPIVVMGHLLGGALIVSTLTYLTWQLSGVRGTQLSKLHIVVLFSALLVFCQIALGGWVSSNYAGMGCLGFPQCNGHWLPSLHWSAAFTFFASLGLNHQGGLLDPSVRETIHYVHRLGALLVVIDVIVVVTMLFISTKKPLLRIIGMWLLILVTTQCVLGIINVLYLLPLWAAVLHNGVAMLLLISFLSLSYLTSAQGLTGSCFKGALHERVS